MDDLTEKELQILYGEMATKRKTPLVTYLLFFFLGGLGVHKFYLGRVGLGLLYIGLVVGSIGVPIFGAIVAMAAGKYGSGAPTLALVVICLVFWITLPICGIVDIFTIPAQTEAANDRMKSRIASSLINARPRVIQPLPKQEAELRAIEPSASELGPPPSKD